MNAIGGPGLGTGWLEPQSSHLSCTFYSSQFSWELLQVLCPSTAAVVSLLISVNFASTQVTESPGLTVQQPEQHINNEINGGIFINNTIWGIFLSVLVGFHVLMGISEQFDIFCTDVMNV